MGSFLKLIATNLLGNDPWHNNDKPSRQAVYSLVLRCVYARIRKIHFNPADPENLTVLSQSDQTKLVEQIKARMNDLVGEKSGVPLTLLSHSGLGQLSLDRQDSSLGVNAPGQVLVVDCIGYNRYSILFLLRS